MVNFRKNRRGKVGGREQAGVDTPRTKQKKQDTLQRWIQLLCINSVCTHMARFREERAASRALRFENLETDKPQATTSEIERVSTADSPSTSGPTARTTVEGVQPGCVLCIISFDHDMNSQIFIIRDIKCEPNLLIAFF